MNNQNIKAQPQGQQEKQQNDQNSAQKPASDRGVPQAGQKSFQGDRRNDDRISQGNDQKRTDRGDQAAQGSDRDLDQRRSSGNR